MSAGNAKRGPFFGRKRDIEYLFTRIENPGMTAVLGRPQIGKTRLLVELRERLRDKPHSRRPLVGYFKATTDTINHLLYALRDLNVGDWLPNASYREQAKRLFAGRGEQMITRFGQSFGKAIAPFLRILDPNGDLGVLVCGAFDTLHEADADLRTGGLNLGPIACDQACSLAWLLHVVSDRRLVLILDAFEQQPEVSREIGLLRALL